MQTNEMSLALRERLVQLGWKPERVTWGRRVNGDMHGVTLERNGVETYHPGPLTTVKVGNQSAIVRWR